MTAQKEWVKKTTLTQLDHQKIQNSQPTNYVKWLFSPPFGTQFRSVEKTEQASEKSTFFSSEAANPEYLNGTDSVM